MTTKFVRFVGALKQNQIGMYGDDHGKLNVACFCSPIILNVNIN